MTRLDGKVALVTGAGMGIGEAVALSLAASGAAVAAFDLDEAAVQQTVAAIEAAGGTALARAGDVRMEADVESAVAAAVEAFGGLDLLANIAGVIRASTVPDCDEATWDLIVDTNLKGSFLCAKHAIPELRKRGGGAIVSAASVLAFASIPEQAVYCATKGAIVALTRTMALDHAREGIRVNCIAPGSVRTPLFLSAIREGDDVDAAVAATAESHPLGRLIEPDEVARLVRFLLSDDASAITGGCYTVDNGLLSQLALA